jgi:protein gp37
MSDRSAIEWTDATWNPVVGCDKVSEGCEHCYAIRDGARLQHLPAYADTIADGEWTGLVRCLPERLDQPLRWRKPRRVFVNSMSDLFHPDVPDGFIARVFAVMAEAPQHTFQVLTKRPGRMASLLGRADFPKLVDKAACEFPDLGYPLREDGWHGEWPLPNAWMGTSVESQKWADVRVPKLLETPAAVRFLSCEPLLGAIDLSRSHPGFPYIGSMGGDLFQRSHIDWVIVGGESGPDARPMHPDWARALRDQCQAAGVAYLHKQNGEWAPVGPLYTQDEDENATDEAIMEAVHVQVIEHRQVVQLERSGFAAEGYQPTDPRTWLMARVGKHAAGRELDGRTWDQYPSVLEAAR